MKHYQFVVTLCAVALAIIAGPLAARADSLDDASVRLFNVQKNMAEKNNDSQAQFHLAQMYELGLGTPEDPVQARAWYQRAAASGHPMAERQLREMDRQHDTEQTSAAALAPPKPPNFFPDKQPVTAATIRPQATSPIAPEARTPEQERRNAEAKARAERKRAAEALLRQMLAKPHRELFE